MEATNTARKFMVIDDDPTNNYICSRYIKVAFPTAFITAFTLPQEGLDAILETGTSGQAAGTILFLDINMPVLNGWDVLAKFATYPEAVRKQFTIYILSSSINADDKKKAADSPFVSGFIEKPLSVERLREMA